jgi:hypothetical protein
LRFSFGFRVRSSAAPSNTSQVRLGPLIYWRGRPRGRPHTMNTATAVSAIESAPRMSMVARIRRSEDKKPQKLMALLPGYWGGSAIGLSVTDESRGRGDDVESMRLEAGGRQRKDSGFRMEQNRALANARNAITRRSRQDLRSDHSGSSIFLLNSPCNQPFVTSESIGSGSSHSTHRKVRRPPPGGRAKTIC